MGGELVGDAGEVDAALAVYFRAVPLSLCPSPNRYAVLAMPGAAAVSYLP
jgi:hypothetical protein